jgi:hypothetical protein
VSHHPDIHLTMYREVEVVIWTHAMGGLTLSGTCIFLYVYHQKFIYYMCICMYSFIHVYVYHQKFIYCMCICIYSFIHIYVYHQKFIYYMCICIHLYIYVNMCNFIYCEVEVYKHTCDGRSHIIRYMYVLISISS